MSYRVRVRVAVPKFAFAPMQETASTSPPMPIKTTQIYVTESSPLAIPVYDRTNLRPGEAIAGPAMIRQLDLTTLLPPDWTARVDAFLNLVLDSRGGYIRR